MLLGLLMTTLRVAGGTRFESAVRTRSRATSNAIDAKLRDDFSQLRDEIIKWGELACSTTVQGAEAMYLELQ